MLGCRCRCLESSSTATWGMISIASMAFEASREVSAKTAKFAKFRPRAPLTVPNSIFANNANFADRFMNRVLTDPAPSQLERWLTSSII